MTAGHLPAVRVRMAGVRRNLGADELFILFASTDRSAGPVAEIAAVEAARDHANDAAAPETVVGEVVSAHPRGPVVRLKWTGTNDENQKWLSDFAAHLEAAGWAGNVGVVRNATFPDETEPAFDNPKLTAFAAYTMDQAPAYNPANWGVIPETTLDIAGHSLGWAAAPDARIYLSRGLSQVEAGEVGLADGMAWGAQHGHLSAITYIRPRPLLIHRVALAVHGQALYQVYDAERTWQQQLHTITAALLQAPAPLDLAFVRRSVGWCMSWIQLNQGTPPFPHVHEGHVRLNRHLIDRFIPDAHGVQVLTDSHLERATNLDGWDIQPLPHGRHLVQAKDLAPWYAGTTPDPDTLHQARADFRDVLLTHEIIAANPPLGTAT